MMQLGPVDRSTPRDRFYLGAGHYHVRHGRMASLSPYQDLLIPTKNVACKIGLEMEFERPRRPLELRRRDRRREWSADASDIEVQFWGVRGSIACPDPELARYGGNTSCVEVRCGDSLLILDAGTGLRGLGRSLVAGGEAVRADILLSHCHIDHIIGLPFFAPCHIPTTSLRLWAGHLSPLATALRQMMSEPLFPIGFESFKAAVELHDFCAGEVLTPAPGVTVRTASLNHPGGATGIASSMEQVRSPISPTPSTVRASSIARSGVFARGSASI